MRRTGLSALLASACFLLLATSCATIAKLFPSTSTPIPSGSLVLGEVYEVATRAEIVESGLYDFLVGVGIPDSEIRDGSIALARTQCCGGPEEESNVVGFYVPPG